MFVRSSLQPYTASASQVILGEAVQVCETRHFCLTINLDFVDCGSGSLSPGGSKWRLIEQQSCN